MPYHQPCTQVLVDERHDTSVLDGVRKELNKLALVHRIKELLQVEIYTVHVAVVDDSLRALQGLVCAPARAETIAPVREFRLVHQAQYLRYGLLDDAVNNGGNAELAHLASVLGDFYPADGIRTVLAVQQTFNYFHLVASQIWEQLLHIHHVNATTPLVRLNLFVGSVKVLALASDHRSSCRELGCTQASCLSLVALLRGRLRPSQSKSALPHSLRVPRYHSEDSFLLFSAFLPSSGNL